MVLLFTLHITKNIAYHITEVLIFYADKHMVKNLRVFYLVILAKDTFYSMPKTEETRRCAWLATQCRKKMITQETCH